MTVMLVLAIIGIDLLLRLIRRSPAGAASTERPGIVVRSLRILVNLGAFLALVGAAATSLTAPATGLTGDDLVRHVTIAPVFAVAAVIVTLFWAHRNRFAPFDGRRLTSPTTWAAPLRKFFFWLSVALTVPTLLSILAAMFPIFGTEDQQKLIQIHRTLGPLLTAAGALFTYFALVTWWERSKD